MIVDVDNLSLSEQECLDFLSSAGRNWPVRWSLSPDLFDDMAFALRDFAKRKVKEAAEQNAPALPLEQIATDALLAELKRRAWLTAQHELELGDAIARAEMAEAKLAQAMAALTGAAHG